MRRRVDRTAWQTSREEGRGRRCSPTEAILLGPDLRQNLRQATHRLPNLRPSHRRLLPTKASPGESAGIKKIASHIHQVKRHLDGAFIFVSPQNPAPRLPSHPHLPLRLRVLIVSDDGRNWCLDSRRGTLRRPWVVRASRKVATGGNAQPNGEKEKEREPAKDDGSSAKMEGGGGRKEGDARVRDGFAAASQPGV